MPIRARCNPPPIAPESTIGEAVGNARSGAKGRTGASSEPPAWQKKARPVGAGWVSFLPQARPTTSAAAQKVRCRPMVAFPPAPTPPCTGGLTVHHTQRVRSFGVMGAGFDACDARQGLGPPVRCAFVTFREHSGQQTGPHDTAFAVFLLDGLPTATGRLPDDSPPGSGATQLKRCPATFGRAVCASGTQST